MKSVLIVLGISLSVLVHAQHLEFQTDGVAISPEVEEQCRRQIKFQNEFYHDMFGSWLVRDIKVLVTSDTAQFTWLYAKTGRFHGQDEITKAFYWPKTDLIYIFYEDDSDLVSSFAHELSHMMMEGASRCIGIRHWLDEGMAEYFATLRLDENGKATELPLYNYAGMKSLTARPKAFEEFIRYSASLEIGEDPLLNIALSKFFFEKRRSSMKTIYEVMCNNTFKPARKLKRLLGRDFFDFVPEFQTYFKNYK